MKQIDPHPPPMSISLSGADRHLRVLTGFVAKSSHYLNSVFTV